MFVRERVVRRKYASPLTRPNDEFAVVRKSERVYFQVIDAYRDKEGRPRQRTVLSLDPRPLADQIADAQANGWVDRLERLRYAQSKLGDWAPPEHGADARCFIPTPASICAKRDAIARTIGKSWKTYEKAKAVCEAAAREPERFGHLVKEMDRTRKVDGVYKRLVTAIQADAIRHEKWPADV